jgi:hypothetical protein
MELGHLPEPRSIGRQHLSGLDAVRPADHHPAVPVGLGHRPGPGQPDGRAAHRARQMAVGHRLLPMWRSSATSRCWCSCSSGTSCCRRCCPSASATASSRTSTPSPSSSCRPWCAWASSPPPGSASRSARASTALPRGQKNAGLALGFTLPQTYRHVLLPMAFRLVVPPLTSEFLNIFKNSAVCSTIGLLELAAQGRQLVDYTAQPYESFIAVTAALSAHQRGGHDPHASCGKQDPRAGLSGRQVTCTNSTGLRFPAPCPSCGKASRCPWKSPSSP